MEQSVPKTEYSVGLTRDEYVRSQALVTRALRGRLATGGRLVSIIAMLMCAGLVAAEYRATGAVEPQVAVILTLMMIAELWTMLALPERVRRQHRAAYDASLFAGHSFDGVVTVDEYGITKRTADEINRVEFARCDAWIEAEDMLLFCINGGKSIVIPARCLTEDAAEQTKGWATAAIPVTRQYRLSELVPLLEAPLPLNTCEAAEASVQLTVCVEYTAGEMRSQLTDTALHAYAENFPQKMLVSVFFTMIFYFIFEMSVLPLFLAGMLLQLFMDVSMARLKAHRAIARTKGDACRLRMELTDRGLQFLGRGEGACRVTLPWTHISRAVERPKEVEFYVERHRFITVPKRCVKDMDELRTMVDRYMIQGGSTHV